jgi:two-component system, NarL family, nitrate/nitrite response regulator NarL
MNTPPLPVLVIAASPALRAGIAALLADDPGLIALSTPPVDGELPVAAVADLAGTGRSSADIARDFPGVPLVLLGADPAQDGPGLAGAPVAYLAADTDAPALAAAVRAVAAGLFVIDPELASAARLHAHASTSGDDATLTPREQEVLALVADGLPNKAIARELGISEHTVKFHVGSLLGKLGAGSRTEAVTLATRRGILSV